MQLSYAASISVRWGVDLLLFQMNSKKARPTVSKGANSSLRIKKKEVLGGLFQMGVSARSRKDIGDGPPMKEIPHSY